MREFFSFARELELQSRPFVVVTLVQARGHSPQDPGAKAIVTAEGLAWGTVGGGKVEARAIGHAQRILARAAFAPPELVVWNLQRDIGMTCGGEVSYLFELHASEAWPIAVFGAGHVAQALVRSLLALDCQVTCVDERAEWIEKLPAAPGLRKLRLPVPAELVSELDARHFFVCMTQGHATDVPILAEIFRRFPEAPYVGVIGSDVKGLKIRQELKAMGIGEMVLEKLRCPIGLPLGTNAPAEIAISVTAELLQVRDRSRKT